LARNNAGQDGLGSIVVLGLLAEALMRDAVFRPRRRFWAADADRCRLEARVCAAGLVEHLHRCGIRWSRQQPAPPHRTT
jgi:hypothetical protein